MTKVLHKLISKDQHAFLPGRYIGEAIRLIDDILFYTDSENIPGIMFGADFSAAFDSVDHIFMHSVLKRFGFKKSFISWIKVLYTNLESAIINNGTTSRYFSLERGTRQGDPIAPHLFLLVAEVLAEQVRSCQNIEGIPVFDSTYKI